MLTAPRAEGRAEAGVGRILMLASAAHEAVGGIAQYNRDVLDALSHDAAVEEVVVLPRIGPGAGFAPPAKVRYDSAAAGGKGAFLSRALAHAFGGGRYDLVYCAHINLIPAAALIARRRRIPLALAIYGIDAWRAPESAATRESARACRHVIACSQVTLERFQTWAGAAQATTAVLPGAVHDAGFGAGPKRCDLVSRFGLKGRRVVMSFGRMHPAERYKGFDEVIEALPALRRRSPDITYLIAGDGEDRPRLEAKARALGVADAVVFAGLVPEAGKADYYRLADAFVMAGFGEGFGFVILEALACGLPVVASTRDGSREAVLDGKLGALVDPSDPAALQAAILKALARPKAVPAGLAHFSPDAFGERLAAALREICRGRSAASPKAL